MNKAEELGYTRLALITHHKDKMRKLVDFLKANEKFKGLELFWGVSCTIPVLRTKGYEFSLEELLEAVDGRKKVTT